MPLSCLPKTLRALQAQAQELRQVLKLEPESRRVREQQLAQEQEPWVQEPSAPAARG